MNAVTEQVSSTASGLTTAAFPRIGEYWAGQGGKFRGICKGADGPDYFLIEHDEELPVGPWDKAIEAAKAVTADGHTDFSLPTRAEAALCYATAKDEHEEDWYWTSEQRASFASFAWGTYFGDGYQYGLRKVTSYRARAVRRTPLQ